MLWRCCVSPDQSGLAQKPLGYSFGKRLCLGLKYLIVSAQTWLENVPLPSENIQWFCIPQMLEHSLEQWSLRSAARVLTDPDIYCRNVLKHRNCSKSQCQRFIQATGLILPRRHFDKALISINTLFPVCMSKVQSRSYHDKSSSPCLSHSLWSPDGSAFSKTCQESLFLDNPAYDGDMIRHKCRPRPKCSQTTRCIINRKLNPNLHLEIQTNPTELQQCPWCSQGHRTQSVLNFLSP